MKKLFVPFLLLLVTLHVSAQKTKDYKIAFWNLENFFDLINDPEVRDDEFTPEGPKKWNANKYAIKLANVERVLFDMSAFDRNYPAVIGVSEVETRGVLEDIVSTPKLSPANYHIVHYDSPERRGVDVAFFYRPDQFRKQGEKAIRTVIPSMPDFRTRDILTMWGEIDNEQFLFMVAHWPSRLGGKERSSHLRETVARQMRHIADSICALRPETKVVMMGDFNDDPTDPSVIEGLGAKAKIKEVQSGDYFAPYTEVLKSGRGTLAYRDAWNLFDNIVISENLATGSTGKLQIKKAPKNKFYGNIFRRHYMVQKEGSFKGYPLRTYVGNNFQGGFSDHFPVYIYVGK